MSSAADSKPLDLDRIAGFLEIRMDVEHHAGALLAECRRQRDEIARLRGVLAQIDDLPILEGEDRLAPAWFIEAARAALAGEGA